MIICQYCLLYTHLIFTRAYSLGEAAQGEA